MIDSDKSAELKQAAEILQRLSSQAECFLDKSAPDFAQLSQVRASANRLIEAIKTHVRRGRGQIDGPPGKEAEPKVSTLAVAAPVPDTARASVPPIRCYVCRIQIDTAHPQYPRLCRECGGFNQVKREQTADLSGRRAIVTGARVRIGFQTALKLLRAGASVDAVSRFPALALQRYAEQPDYDDWQSRLTVQGLDLRHLAAVHAFADEIVARGPVDVLINNAAQTVGRPSEFYAALRDRERQATARLSTDLRSRLSTWDAHALTVADAASVQVEAPRARQETVDRRLEPTERETVAIARSAWMTQLSSLSLDAESENSTGLLSFDNEGEPIDLRTENSWSQRIDSVPGMELLEVHAINALAPFLLIQRLLPAFRRSPNARRFIINVAAKEGRFSEQNASRHPHTNMAKAALNMLTKTIAGELARDGIYVNSVDPGWISDQRPFPQASREREQSGDWLPLDAIDAAARVLDPIWMGVASAEAPLHGCLWRNYAIVPW